MGKDLEGWRVQVKGSCSDPGMGHYRVDRGIGALKVRYFVETINKM